MRGSKRPAAARGCRPKTRGLPWTPSPNNTVYSLSVSGGVAYAGGGFTTIGGQVRDRIAALDAATGNATAWNPSASTTVSALTVTNNRVHIGGSFTELGGQPRGYYGVACTTTPCQ